MGLDRQKLYDGLLEAFEKGKETQDVSGGEDGEVLTAAEILYDNGFDSFNYADSFESLFSNIDASFLTITDAAKKKINGPSEDQVKAQVKAIDDVVKAMPALAIQ